MSCSHAHTLPLPERLLPDAQALFPSRTQPTSTCVALLLTWLQHAPAIAPTAAWLLCTAVPRRVFMSMSMCMVGTHQRHARSAAACMETSLVCVGKGCCVMTRTRHYSCSDHDDQSVWRGRQLRKSPSSLCVFCYDLKALPTRHLPWAGLGSRRPYWLDPKVRCSKSEEKHCRLGFHLPNLELFF